MAFTQEMINGFVIAAHHDLEKVKAMLAEHPDLLNENAEWIETPIQAAAHVGSRAIAEFLLEQGAPLDICTAAALGRTADVRAMLADDPSLAQARGAHNIPSLYFAAIGGSLEIAQALYEAGADINANPGKNTPLHGAAGFGRTEIVHWMLEQGADPAATDFNDLTPLEVAEKTGHQAAADAIRAKMAQYDAQLDAEDAAQ